DPSGHYEAVIFQEGLQQYRDLLEPGTAVLLFLTAEAQGDEGRARVQSAEPLDQAAAKLQKRVRGFVRDGKPPDGGVKGVERRRNGNGGSRPPQAASDGEVNIIVLLNAGAEVELKLPGRYKVSPQIAGAIKAVPGVVEVQAV